MAAFDFPNPPNLNEEVTNDATGVTYRYDGATQTWVIVGASITQNFATAGELSAETTERTVADNTLSGRIDALESAEVPDQITYQIQTDKVLRSGEPAIELVDSEGFFSNVKFETSGLISVSSSASSIVVNSNKIEDRVDEGLSEHDEQLQVHSNQINVLETQILLLAQTRAVGRWNYVRNVANGPRPPETKTFYATNGADSSVVVNNWADARLLMVSKTDLSDSEFTFTGFEEGDKLEILATDGSSACYGSVINSPTQESYGNLRILPERTNGGPIENKEYVLSVYRPGAVGGEVDLDTLDGRYIVKTGDEMTGNLKVPDPLPNEPLHAANKKYVDEAISGGVPVGSIMIWINNNPPPGWFKLSGGTFDTSAYPKLHAYLLNTNGYVSGTLPNWAGHYPGESGGHLTSSLGSFADYLTALPRTIDFTTDNPGNHTHKYGNSAVSAGGSQRSAYDATNASSFDTGGSGSHTHKITSGGDSTTRPKTVVVHFIIKHD